MVGLPVGPGVEILVGPSVGPKVDVLGDVLELGMVPGK